MVRGIKAAVAELRRDPQQPVTTEIEGMVVELRCKGHRTADDIFREIKPLDDESAEEMSRIIREARKESRIREASKEPPRF